MTASELRSSFPTSFLLRVKEARKKHVVEPSTTSSVNVAVRPSSSKNIKYLLDLLTFAVETGRLTESCGRILTALLRDRNSTLLKLPLSPGENNKPLDQEVIEDDVEEDMEQQKDVLSSRSCAGSWCSPTDNDVVLRDVHFRKLYSGDGVRAVASGSTPLDLPSRESYSPPAASSSSRQLRALKCCSDSNRPGALEDLLTRHEKLLGTPLSELRRAVESKASLVRRLVLCVEQANSLSSSIRMTPTPASPPSRRKELYLRLVRALDQRAPPDQRLLPVRKAQSKKKSAASGGPTQAPPAWFFALQQIPRVGSKLFAQESRLSDYMHD